MRKIYDEQFYEREGTSALSAAQIILPYVIDIIKCESIVDFGCGTGEWLNVAKEYWGLEKKNSVLGLDGAYMKKFLKIPQDEFLASDLTEVIELDRKYDLAISLEVAEHLPRDSAKTLIYNLVRHSDIVLFSAAVPYQGGTRHMNEQFPSYWEKMFCEYGFVICDCLRNKFWDDERIEVYYRQNIFLFCKKAIESDLTKRFGINNKMTDIIHPDFWKKRSLYNYLFPFEMIEYGKRVIIYGAGMVGSAYVNQILFTGYAKMVLWCDRAFEDHSWRNCGIVAPEQIVNTVYDYVLIAIKNESVALEIKDTLLAMGITKKKIIWRNPVYKNVY